MRLPVSSARLSVGRFVVALVRALGGPPRAVPARGWCPGVASRGRCGRR
ncbi:hypothetical protein B0I33_113206 [Prauserella shujinwangii]|uniref:Uncharacterized protein n=1 Tax=Prauserella shujinwangii TaxID=1453103 RepID=A0A2T0LM43_9PSEU|nr:hypothetical protein B0I33_113206 [Prauserella shujinwangii]